MSRGKPVQERGAREAPLRHDVGEARRHVVGGVVVHRFFDGRVSSRNIPLIIRSPSLAPIHPCHSLGGCPSPVSPVPLRFPEAGPVAFVRRLCTPSPSPTSP